MHIDLKITSIPVRAAALNVAQQFNIQDHDKAAAPGNQLMIDYFTLLISRWWHRPFFECLAHLNYVFLEFNPENGELQKDPTNMCNKKLPQYFFDEHHGHKQHVWPQAPRRSITGHDVQLQDLRFA